MLIISRGKVPVEWRLSPAVADSGSPFSTRTCRFDSTTSHGNYAALPPCSRAELASLTDVPSVTENAKQQHP